MAEGQFENIVTGLILIGLFAFLAIAFSFGLASNYGKDVGNVDAINYTALNQSLSQVQSKGESYFAMAQERGVFLAVAGFVVVGIFDIGMSMLNFAKDFFDIIFIQIFNNILHIPPIVTGVVLFILIVSMIIGLWRLIKVGQ